MKNIKALFVDCDGVLYDKNNLSYQDMAVVAFGRTIRQFNISEKEVRQRHQEQNEKGVHGLFNVALSFCNERDISFREFAYKMAENTDYSRIPEDKEMLSLLQNLGEKMPVYIVTDNTWSHLLHILSRLNGSEIRDIFSPLNIMPITIENTLYDGAFHPKRVGNQLESLCVEIDQMPHDVLLLDDTSVVCETAKSQGFQVVSIEGPEHTKKILKGVLHEKSKRCVSVRETRGRTGR